MKSFAQTWLDIQCQSIEGLCCAIFLLSDSQGNGLNPAAQWPPNSKDSLELVAISKLAVTNRNPMVNSSTGEASTEKSAFDYLATPIYISNELIGVIAVKTTGHEKNIQQQILNALASSTKWLAMPQSADVQQDPFYMTVVRLAVQCLQQDSVAKIFTVLINQLTSEFECERVAVGDINNHHAQVIALSNSAKFDDKSNLIQTLSAAMDEAIDQDQVIVYPKAENEITSITYAHAELARKFGSGAICTIPFVFDESVFAVLTMERSEANPFDQKTVSICEQTLALISPFLKLKHNDELFWTQKLALSTKNLLAKLLGYQYLGLKLLAITLFVFTGFAATKAGDFRISADAVLEGRIQRTISAPIDGYIKTAIVRAGDTVLKGQTMVIMESVDLKLEKSKLTGEQQQLQREYREAMANRELVKVRVLNAQLTQIEAKIKLKEEQIQRTYIKSPFNGIIIDGDLSQSLGAPVDRGDNLFTLAPLEGYRVILKVNERSISYIRHAQKGTLALSSLPDRKFPLQIEKITAVAVTDDGSNVFRVEASLPDTPKLLRPGMEGVGKVEIGQETLLWIWTHKLIDWVKLWMWSWWP